MIVTAVLCIAVALFFLFSGGAKASDTVIVRSESGEERVSLLEDRCFSLTSHGITLTLEVKQGEIAVVSSDCPDQTCTQMRPIGIHNGGSIVCLPALVEIRSEGRSDGHDQPHAVAY